VQRGKLVKTAVRIVCFVLGVIMAARLLNSYSRGAWVGTICGLAYLITTGFELRPSKFSRWIDNHGLPLLIIAVSIAVLTGWELRGIGWNPARRVVSASSKNDFSTRNRLAAWEGAMKIAGDHFLFGAGWNEPERLYENYYRPSQLTEAAAIEMNDYTMLGAAIGIPALVCFGVFVWLRLTQRRDGVSLSSQCEGESGMSAPADRLSATCRGGATVLLVGFMFDGGLFKLPTAAVFWVLLELGAGEQEVTTKANALHRREAV
jgi:O-antigen ligase